MSTWCQQIVKKISSFLVLKRATMSHMRNTAQPNTLRLNPLDIIDQSNVDVGFFWQTELFYVGSKISSIWTDVKCILMVFSLWC